MKVLQIHGTDVGTGGGPIAMLRLHDGLRNVGVNSRILCMRPTRGESVAYPRLRGEGRLRALTTRLGFNELHSLGSFRIPKLSAYAEADLLHIHGVHGGYFSSLALPWLTKTKPAVYTLHDMWPFTGHCVYSYDCDRWKSGCGRCPYPELPDAIQRDATSWEWQLKQWSYRNSKLTIAAPSRWLCDLARQSMLGEFGIHHIPQGVDTDLYRPLDRDLCRSALGISLRKKVILFLVRRMNLSHEASHTKGADLLARAIGEIPDSLRREMLLLLVGEGGETFARDVDVETVSLGFVSNDRLKALAYSAADLFVFPSRAENAPLVLIESMACGTPMVAFRVGGVPEAVRPGLTGLLAEPGDTKEFSSAIVKILENAEVGAQMSHHCRTIAVKEYPLSLHIDRYIALYRQVLKPVAA